MTPTEIQVLIPTLAHARLALRCARESGSERLERRVYDEFPELRDAHDIRARDDRVVLAAARW